MPKPRLGGSTLNRDPCECPKCGGKSSVIETRAMLTSRYRRRRCKDCGSRWTTQEITQQDFELLRTYGKRIAKVDSFIQTLKDLTE